LKEVKQLKELNTVRSYLKLYSTIPLQKLASFLEIDVNTLNTRLTNLKNKSKQLKWKRGPALSGELEETSDIEFVVDKVVL
jgi:translation initiation factor 3 subunit L